MNLAEKMFGRSSKSCQLRSDCSKRSSKVYFDSLFESDWEVFVIKHDSNMKTFNWFTLCCEDVSPRSV